MYVGILINNVTTTFLVTHVRGAATYRGACEDTGRNPHHTGQPPLTGSGNMPLRSPISRTISGHSESKASLCARWKGQRLAGRPVDLPLRQ